MAVRLNKAVKQSVSLLSGFKQWGICTVPISVNSSLWNFPLAFPTGMMNALACVADPSANGTYRISIGGTTKNYAKIVSTITEHETVVYCFAIGK